MLGDQDTIWSTLVIPVILVNCILCWAYVMARRFNRTGEDARVGTETRVTPMTMKVELVHYGSVEVVRRTRRTRVLPVQVDN